MSRFIEDKDGDHIEVLGEQEGALFGVTIAATQRDRFESTGETETMHAVVGPVDPHALIEAIKAECELHEDDEVHDKEPETYGHTTAAEAHQHLAEHWERRLKVVEQALSMLPAPGKRGGMLAAFAGEETPDPLRVENALKIARFAADEDRDIPGVDR